MNRMALLTVAILLQAGTAQAVVQTSGFLEIDDPTQAATIDMQFFSISNVEDVEFQFDIRAVGDPLSSETLAAHLWTVDAGGMIDMLLASGSTAPGAFTFSIDRFAADQLPVGHYAFVVGTKELEADEFPPLQIDSATPSGLVPSLVEYEISTLVGQNALSYACAIEGNLDGTTSKTVFVPGTACAAPQAAVSEPGALPLLVGGLALAGLVSGRARGRRLGLSRQLAFLETVRTRRFEEVSAAQALLPRSATEVELLSKFDRVSGRQSHSR